MSERLKFAHFADLHLGGWRERKLTELNFLTFRSAIDKVVESGVKFCLFSGDIFNSAVPSFDIVEKVVREFLRLRERGIKIFVVGGSHDYSCSGKGFLELLETAGVFENVAKHRVVDRNESELVLFEDAELKLVLGGVSGRRNGLDRSLYESLKVPEIRKDFLSVFLFHCLLDDFKPSFMRKAKSDVVSSHLPLGFDYYAGGHVHSFVLGEGGKGVVCYPGALFPNSFSELVRERPCFNLCEFDFGTRGVEVERVFVENYESLYLKIDVSGLNPIEARRRIEDEIEKFDVSGKLVLLEVFGVLEGRVLDIGLSDVVDFCYGRGAFYVLKNTYKLTSSFFEFEAGFEEADDSAFEVEERVIDEVLTEEEKGKGAVRSLLSLELGKMEGEKVLQYEERVVSALEKVLERFGEE